MSVQNHLEPLRMGLKKAYDSTRALLSRIGEGDWDRPIDHGEDHRTVRQMVAHLVDAQRSMTRVIQAARQGENLVPPDFDLARWNARIAQKMSNKDPAELRAEYERDRAALMAVVDTLSDADLDKQGRHGSLRILSIAEFLQLIADHEMEHGAQIAAALNVGLSGFVPNE